MRMKRIYRSMSTYVRTPNRVMLALVLGLRFWSFLEHPSPAVFDFRLLCVQEKKFRKNKSTFETFFVAPGRKSEMSTTGSKIIRNMFHSLLVKKSRANGEKNSNGVQLGEHGDNIVL